MKSMQPKIGNTLWGVWEHRYYNEKRLVELEYVVYPVKITRFFKGKYVDAHCVGVDVDGHTAVHYCLTKRVQICRGRLTVGLRIANPSSGQSPACEFESRSLRHMLMWPSGRWQRSRKPPVRNRPKVRILP